MAGRVTVSFNGGLGVDGIVPFDARFSYDPAQPPASVSGNRAVYRIDDPQAVFEIDGAARGPVTVDLVVTDGLNVNGAGILFVDSLRIEISGTLPGDPWRYEVEPVTLDTASLAGTALPAGPFDFAGFGESTLVNRLVDPTLALGFIDAPLADFGLGADAFQLTTSEARLVALLFEIALDRNGALDPEGINFWIDKREAGLTLEGLGFNFLNNAEFISAFGDPAAMTDRGLVERLFLNGLDRPGAEVGIAFWTAALADPGFSRADLLIAFADSFENRGSLSLVDTLVEVAPGEWDFTM